MPKNELIYCVYLCFLPASSLKPWAWAGLLGAWLRIGWRGLVGLDIHCPDLRGVCNLTEQTFLAKMPVSNPEGIMILRTTYQC